MRFFAPALTLSAVYALKLGDQSNSEEFTFDCARPLLIYSQGKTGTTTMDESFGQYCNKSVALLRAPPTSEWPRAVRCNGFLPVCRGFLDRYADEQMTVVTMVRNPWEKLISLYFQVVVRHYFETGSDKASLSYTEKEFSEYIYQTSRRPGTFFYDDWQNKLNMSFSRIKLNNDGHFQHFWKTHNGGRVYNIILLRVEDGDSWETTLQEQLPNWKLITMYEAASKDYASLYDEFKKDFVWTQAEVDMVKNHGHSVLEAFYTTKERQAMEANLNVGGKALVQASRKRNQAALFRTLDKLMG